MRYPIHLVINNHLIFAISIGLLLFGIITDLHATNLLEVYMLAQHSDPSYNTKQLFHQQELQKLKLSRSSLLPTITAQGNTSYIDAKNNSSKSNYSSRGNFIATQYGINLNQSILSLKNYLHYKQQYQKTLSSSKSTQAAEQDLILDIAEKYFSILAANDCLDTYTSNFKSIAKQLEQLEKKFKIGTIAITDVLAAKARLDQINAKIIIATNAVTIAKQQLNQMLAKKISHLVPLKIQLNLSTPKPNDINLWIAQARKYNLDIQAVRYQLAAAKHQHAAAASEYLPSLDLAGKIQKSIHEPPNSNNSLVKQIGINLNLPVFNGGAISANSKFALLGVDMALQQLELAYRNVETNTIISFNNILSNIANISATEKSIESYKAALSAQQNAFAAGTRTILDVLDTETELLTAEKDLISCKYDYIINSLKLKKAIGTLNVEDLKDINNLLASDGTISSYSASSKLAANHSTENHKHFN